MTKEELQGIAMQALNLAKTDITNHVPFSFLLATWAPTFKLRRMRMVEELITDKVGEGWLGSGPLKSAVCDKMRTMVQLVNPPCLIMVTPCNLFKPTSKLSSLPMEEQKELIKRGHDSHHEMAKQGYFEIVDSLTCVAQTMELVCVASYAVDEGKGFIGQPEVRCFLQEEFEGRMKFYGKQEVAQ